MGGVGVGLGLEMAFGGDMGCDYFGPESYSEMQGLHYDDGWAPHYIGHT